MINYIKTNKQFWDDNAFHYETIHPEHCEPALHPSWGIRHIPENKLRFITDTISPGSTIVEVGCGTGHDILGFSRLGYRSLGFDSSKEMIRNTPSGQGAIFTQAPAEKLPIPDGSVDAVYSDHGAFDFSPAEPLLAEARRVLRPGGILVICTYSSIATICFDESTKQTSDYLRRPYKPQRIQTDGKIVVFNYSEDRWISMATAAGFKINRLELPLAEKSDNQYFSESPSVEWSTMWPAEQMWVFERY